MAFYEKYIGLKSELEERGHTVVAPQIEPIDEGIAATSIDTSSDTYDSISTLPHDHEFWMEKGAAISAYFRKIDVCDAILVTNYEKNGVPHYIGGNTFLEMGYAFGRGKKIFILNDLPAASVYIEEILGMQPMVLHDDTTQIL